LVPLLFVTALEVLYQYSNAREGIANAPVSTYSRYSWLYVPVAAKIALSAFFTQLDSTERSLHSYHALAKSRASSKVLMQDNPGKVAVQNFMVAVLNRNFTLSWIALAVLLAPLLSVFVSGLYTSQPFLENLDIRLQYRDWFDIQPATWNYTIFERYFPFYDLESTDKIGTFD
jgi:hypothetical protein